MRNMKQYPVTPEEVEQVLTQIKEDIMDEGRMGDPSPIVISLTLDFVASKKDEFAQFLKDRS